MEKKMSSLHFKMNFSLRFSVFLHFYCALVQGSKTFALTACSENAKGNLGVDCYLCIE